MRPGRQTGFRGRSTPATRPRASVSWIGWRPSIHVCASPGCGRASSSSVRLRLRSAGSLSGRCFPSGLLRASLVPVSPAIPELLFQAVHSDDVGEAYRTAVLSDCTGAFNIAAEPVIGPAELADMLHARPVRIAPRVLRAGAAVSYRLRLQPAEPGWVDMGLGVDHLRHRSHRPRWMDPPPADRREERVSDALDRARGVAAGVGPDRHRLRAEHAWPRPQRDRRGGRRRLALEPPVASDEPLTTPRRIWTHRRWGRG